MIAHATKAKDFREVQTAEAFYQRGEVVFFSVVQREKKAKGTGELCKLQKRKAKNKGDRRIM